jgi:anaerobic ribonucleoside-triphosphate reductase
MRKCEHCGHTGEFKTNGDGDTVVCPKCNRHDNGIGKLQDQFGYHF